MINEWEQGNTLFLAHTQELITQSAEKLGDELGYKPIVEMNIQGGDPSGFWQGGLCVVASVQSMRSNRRLEKYKDHPFGLIVIDECHHSTSATYRKIIDYYTGLNPECRVVGITATPNRADGAALGIVFESVAYQMTIEDAIEGGWLVPIRQEVVTIESLDFSGVSVKTSTLTGDKDFAAGELEDVLMEEETLHGMAMATLEKVGDRPTLIFTAGVKQAAMLADVLNRYKSNSARFVSGETPKDERREILTDFTAGRLQFVANCQVLTEGFDAPVCAAIVMGRPTKSVSLYIQMLGRGLRPLAGCADGWTTDFDRKMAILSSSKPTCMVLDFAGVSDHKLVNAIDVLGGNYDIETRELADEASRTGQYQDVQETLRLAQLLAALRKINREREHIKARDVQFHSYESNPFGEQTFSPGAATERRGGASDAQVGLLVNLGVDRRTAMGYSKRQAGAVIDSMGSTRCTAKQAKTLAKFGVPLAGIGIERASRIIDAIAANGWKPLREVPA